MKLRLWLREKRKAAGMTELMVAKSAGIAQPFYHKIETGMKNPSVDTAKKIAAVLGFHWTLFYPDDDAQGAVV